MDTGDFEPDFLFDPLVVAVDIFKGFLRLDVDPVPVPLAFAAGAGMLLRILGGSGLDPRGLLRLRRGRAFGLLLRRIRTPVLSGVLGRRRSGGGRRTARLLCGPLSGRPVSALMLGLRSPVSASGPVRTRNAGASVARHGRMRLSTRLGVRIGRLAAGGLLRSAAAPAAAVATAAGTALRILPARTARATLAALAALAAGRSRRALSGRSLA
ncbi:MAG: hypothetical protein KBA30_08495, partial [Clostridia bacterium]|nr:hypothetical protein [Clostridia bacterium]